MWAGRNAYTENTAKISSKSLRKYLIGLKAWHHFHATTYPEMNKTRIDLLLKASARLDVTAVRRTVKPPVMLWHLMSLFTSLHGGSDFDNAVLDLCIVAFWSLARLAELTYSHANGPLDYATSVLSTDVTISRSANEKFNVASISLRGAKTAKPGETQLLLLTEQPHILCPIRALERRLAGSGSAQTSLFGFPTQAGRGHVTRRLAVDRIQQVLLQTGEPRLLGHSFRVGGASLRNALGMEAADIRSLGRWTSRCYLLYLRAYSTEELVRTKFLLRNLVANWRKMS
jgi:hypothetical protein